MDLPPHPEMIKGPWHQRAVRPGPGPDFPAAPSLARRAPLPHGRAPPPQRAPNPPDPVPRPALRPPREPARGSPPAALRPWRAPSLPGWTEASPGLKSEPGHPYAHPAGKRRSSPPAPLTSKRSSQPAAGGRLAGSAGLRDLGGRGGGGGAGPGWPAPELNPETHGSHPGPATTSKAKKSGQTGEPLASGEK